MFAELNLKIKYSEEDIFLPSHVVPSNVPSIKQPNTSELKLLLLCYLVSPIVPRPSHDQNGCPPYTGRLKDLALRFLWALPSRIALNHSLPNRDPSSDSLLPGHPRPVQGRSPVSATQSRRPPQGPRDPWFRTSKISGAGPAASRRRGRDTNYQQGRHLGCPQRTLRRRGRLGPANPIPRLSEWVLSALPGLKAAAG